MPTSDPARRALHAALLASAPPRTTWRAQKNMDPIAFNTGAEQEFCTWLTSHLQHKTQGLPFSWVLSNAAYLLGISTETVKRYLLKYTADAAPFYITQGHVHAHRSRHVPPS